MIVKPKTQLGMLRGLAAGPVSAIKSRQHKHGKGRSACLSYKAIRFKGPRKTHGLLLVIVAHLWELDMHDMQAGIS